MIFMDFTYFLMEEQITAKLILFWMIGECDISIFDLVGFQVVGEFSSDPRKLVCLSV